MDCSSTTDEAHKLLAEATFLARKSRKKLFAMDNNRVLRDLADDGYVERLVDGAYHLLVACTCEQMRQATATHRGSRTRSSEQPELTQQTLDDDLSGATSVGSKKTRVSCHSDGPKGRPSDHTSLRSRDGGATQFEELLTTVSPSQLSGKTVSGRRKATEVVTRYQRWGQPQGWQDFPVEKWNAAHLAGYFDAQTWVKCRGLSNDRYQQKAVTKNMSRLRKEGATNEDIKGMVDIFTTRVASAGERVPRLWPSFFANVPELHTLLTSHATGHYNNQPTTSHDDKDFL